MAIAIQLSPTFDIETYDGLVAYIIAHLELDAETAAQVPTFIRKGEYRLDRLLTIPQRENTVSLTSVAGLATIPLPDDIRSVDAIKGLNQKPLTAIQQHYNYSGTPLYYAVGNQFITLGPIPSAADTYELTYLTRLAPLSEANQTNWLLTQNADAYVYSALWQAAGWLEDIDAAVAFRGELMAIIDEINLQSDRYRTGSPLVPNIGCVP